ncbi:class I SAM-dependent methyltransferase [Streptomyces griseoflavus]|uniref:class I SAM-dependent methyltransferase n=1 Tax=Streptomyces griseoflavus TaxID=35619 RepID=UPI003F4BA76F
MNHSTPQRAPHRTRHAHPHDSGHGMGDQADFLDLEADVLAGHIASITAWLPLGAEPGHIVDLGCGTGAGTLALLDRFPGARLTAVDSSTAHLDRLRRKAAAAGAADRTTLVHADLDAADWPALGAPELVWASASLHHMADPGRTLRTVHELLAPGGLLAVVEPAGFPRFLPGDAPETAPGLEERCHALLADHHAAHVPRRGADWAAPLTAAGLTVESRRTLTVGVPLSRTEAVGRYALSGLRRMRDKVAPSLTDGDLTALDGLLDTGGPHSILRRADLSVRTELTVWAARRP